MPTHGRKYRPQSACVGAEPPPSGASRIGLRRPDAPHLEAEKSGVQSSPRFHAHPEMAARTRSMAMTHPKRCSQGTRAMAPSSELPPQGRCPTAPINIRQLAWNGEAGRRTAKFLRKPRAVAGRRTCDGRLQHLFHVTGQDGRKEVRSENERQSGGRRPGYPHPSAAHTQTAPIIMKLPPLS